MAQDPEQEVTPFPWFKIDEEGIPERITASQLQIRLKQYNVGFIDSKSTRDQLYHQFLNYVKNVNYLIDEVLNGSLSVECLFNYHYDGRRRTESEFNDFIRNEAQQFKKNVKNIVIEEKMNDNNNKNIDEEINKEYAKRKKRDRENDDGLQFAPNTKRNQPKSQVC